MGDVASLTSEQLAELTESHGPSFFVLELDRLVANHRRMVNAFEQHGVQLTVGYSYKTNYTPAICAALHDVGACAEVVSGMELELAERLGVPGERIIFNGPARSSEALGRSIEIGATINLDAERDVEVCGRIAADLDRSVQVVLRCNFDIGADTPSRFGFDTGGSGFEALIARLRSHPHLELAGLHCHFPDRDLASFEQRSEQMIRLVRHHFPDRPPRLINLGGGFQSELPTSLLSAFGLEQVEPDQYAAAICRDLVQAFPDESDRPRLVIEPGTALVANTMSFVTQVIETKQVRGRSIATVRGSTFDTSPNARSRHLPLEIVPSTQPRSTGVIGADEVFDVVGFTCIEGDVIAERVDGPIEPGDHVVVGNVGSYSIVMRPAFILPAHPILATWDRVSFECVRRGQTFDDVFSGFRLPKTEPCD